MYLIECGDRTVILQVKTDVQWQFGDSKGSIVMNFEHQIKNIQRVTDFLRKISVTGINQILTICVAFSQLKNFLNIWWTIKLIGSLTVAKNYP